MTRHAGRAAAIGLAVLALLSAAPRRAAAHGLEPALLSLRGLGQGRYEVTWRSSKLRLPGAAVQPVLPARCRVSGPPQAADEGDRLRVRWTVECGADGLAGEVIRVSDLDVATIDALLRIESPGAETIQTVLTAQAPSFVVPAQPSRADVLRRYAAQGGAHLLDGPDPLLFLAGLLLLAPGSLLRSLAAFILAQSAALAATALRATALPVSVVQLPIALVLLGLAAELARTTERATLVRRFPSLLALLVGLLSGAGLAGALRETELPAAQIPAALLAFNAGLALGQLACVAAARALARVTERYAPHLQRYARLPAVYALGVTAAFCCFDRLATWLAGHGV